MNIPDWWQKIKDKVIPHIDRWVGEWGLFAILVLVAFGSFGLGRLSALIEARPLITLAAAPELPSIQPLHMGGLYVASWQGSAYYYPWCDGAQKIAPQNQRWFPDEKSAQAAGYTPAKGCQGLGQ